MGIKRLPSVARQWAVVRTTCPATTCTTTQASPASQAPARSVADGLAAQQPDLAPLLYDSPCGFGAGGPAQAATLRAARHAAVFSATPAHWRLPSLPPGSHPPAWSGTLAD